MSNDPEKACVNCHFFAKRVHPEAFEITTRTVNSEEREQIRGGTFKLLRKRQRTSLNHKIVRHLECYRGVWSEENQPLESNQEREKEYVERDRSGRCFFFNHRPGMELETAEELYDRRREKERFERRNSILWWSVMVALAGVLINAVIQLITLFYSTPK